MEFHIELIVVTQQLIKVETIYETDVVGGSPDMVRLPGEVPRYFGCWGSPEM